jgi:8-oxo-dGTP pyrophosphatase MutT (NUDIX family)
MRRPTRLLYKVAALARRLYWFVVRPKTFGVKCIVECDGRWLMIRNTYGHGRWTFPGGTIDRGETPKQAAIREVMEEVGIRIEEVIPFGIYKNRRQYKRDTVYCFRASVAFDQYKIDEVEIAEAAWVYPDALPSLHGPAVDDIVALLREGVET